MLAFRKHAGWYTRGFRNTAPLRERLMKVETLAALELALAGIDRDEPYPAHAHEMRRGKRAGTQKVALPPGFLDDLDDPTPPCADAEDPTSGRPRTPCA